jgi:hypothetical protein
MRHFSVIVHIPIRLPTTLNGLPFIVISRTSSVNVIFLSNIIFSICERKNAQVAEYVGECHNFTNS